MENCIMWPFFKILRWLRYRIEIRTYSLGCLLAYLSLHGTVMADSLCLVGADVNHWMWQKERFSTSNLQVGPPGIILSSIDPNDPSAPSNVHVEEEVDRTEFLYWAAKLCVLSSHASFPRTAMMYTWHGYRKRTDAKAVRWIPNTAEIHDIKKL